MVQPAENNNNSEDSNVVNLPKRDSLEGKISIVDRDASSEFVGYIPDVHGAGDTVYDLGVELLNKANGKNVWLNLSDIDEKKNRTELMMKKGHMSRSQVGTVYKIQKLAANENENFSERDQDLVAYMSAIEGEGGIDKYLQKVQMMMPGSEDLIKQERERFAKNAKEYKTSGLEGKVNNLISQNKEEFDFVLEMNKQKNQSTNEAISEYIMSFVADALKRLNQYANDNNLGSVKAVAGGGNHDERTTMYVLKELSEGCEVYYIKDIEGWIRLGEESNEYRYQLGGNVHGISHPVDDFCEYDEEKMVSEYEDMFTEPVAPDLVPEMLKGVSLEQILQASAEARRVLKNGQETEKGHHILLHGEYGPIMGYNNINNVLYNAGLLYVMENFIERDEEGNIQAMSGHYHKDAEGLDAKLRMYKIRKAVQAFGINGTQDIQTKYKPANLDLEANWDKIETIAQRNYEAKIAKMQKNPKYAKFFAQMEDYKAAA